MAGRCDTSVLMHAGHVGRQRLGTRHVAACAFAMTCAGPFGVEAAVRCFGPGAFFVGLIVTMLGYVLPQIFMTCELSMMAPLSNSGVTCWISRAFGTKAGKCIGLNMLLYQVVDLATYTTVIVGYAESAGYELDGWIPRLAPVLAIALGLAVNLLAIDMAAEVFMMVLVLVLLPFLVALPWSVPHFPMAWAHTFESSEQSKDLNLFLSSLIWLNTGWDSFGNLAEDVAGPFELIHGLLYAALAAFVVYVLCTFQALTVDGSWEDGYLSVAYRHLWTPLGLWVCISAALANSLLYTSELAVVSRFFQALGGEGSTDVPRLLPSCFKKELSTGAPIVALLVMTVLQLFLLLLTFDYLVQLSTILHVVVYWWQLAAFIHLKVRCPQMQRLYVVPGGSLGAFVVCALKAPVLVMLVISACLDWTLLLGTLVVNCLIYLLVQCVE